MKSGWTTAGPSARWNSAGIRHPVEVVAGRRGLAPAHHRIGHARGEAAHAGHQHHHPERVALGAGDLAQLLVGERDPRDLGALGLAAHDRLVGVDHQRLDPVDDLERLPLDERLAERGRPVPRRLHPQPVLSWRELDREPALRVGLSERLVLLEHGRARERTSGALGADLALHPGARGRLLRRDEVVLEADPHRDRPAALGRGGELQPPARVERRGVEQRVRALGDHRLADAAVLRDEQLQRDRAGGAAARSSRAPRDRRREKAPRGRAGRSPPRPRRPARRCHRRRPGRRPRASSGRRASRPARARGSKETATARRMRRGYVAIWESSDLRQVRAPHGQGAHPRRATGPPALGGSRNSRLLPRTRVPREPLLRSYAGSARSIAANSSGASVSARRVGRCPPARAPRGAAPESPSVLSELERVDAASCAAARTPAFTTRRKRASVGDLGARLRQRGRAGAPRSRPSAAGGTGRAGSVNSVLDLEEQPEQHGEQAVVAVARAARRGASTTSFCSVNTARVTCVRCSSTSKRIGLRQVVRQVADHRDLLGARGLREVDLRRVAGDDLQVRLELQLLEHLHHVAVALDRGHLRAGREQQPRVRWPRPGPELDDRPRPGSRSQAVDDAARATHSSPRKFWPQLCFGFSPWRRRISCGESFVIGSSS